MYIYPFLIWNNDLPPLSCVIPSLAALGGPTATGPPAFELPALALLPAPAVVSLSK